MSLHDNVSAAFRECNQLREALQEIARFANESLDGFPEDLPGKVADIETIARNALEKDNGHD